MLITVKKGSLHGSDFCLLPFGGYACRHLVAADKESVVNDALDIHCFAQVHGLEALSRSAFTYKSVNFHLEFLLQVCYNQFVV